MKSVKSMKIRNRTSLTDFEALCKAALYISGNVEEALEGGYQIEESWNGRVLTVREGDARAGRITATLVIQIGGRAPRL